jgi:hypothetical protein
MKYVKTGILVSASILSTTFDSAAENSSIGLSIISDRDPGNFGDPKNTKYELNGAYTYSGSLILGGSFQYTDTTFSDQTGQNLEGTIGYRMPLGLALSVTGSAGIGQHWRQEPNRRLPVLRSPYRGRFKTKWRDNLERDFLPISRCFRSRRQLRHPAGRNWLHLRFGRRKLDLGQNHAQLERWSAEQYGRLVRI